MYLTYPNLAYPTPLLLHKLFLLLLETAYNCLPSTHISPLVPLIILKSSSDRHSHSRCLTFLPHRDNHGMYRRPVHPYLSHPVSGISLNAILSALTISRISSLISASVTGSSLSLLHLGVPFLHFECFCRCCSISAPVSPSNPIL